MEEYEVVLYHWNQGSLITRCLVFQVIDPFCFFMLDVDSFIPIEMFPIDTDPNTCCPMKDRLLDIALTFFLGLGMVETTDQTRITCFTLLVVVFCVVVVSCERNNAVRASVD